MSQTGKPEEIGALVAQIIKKRKWRRRVNQHQVFDFWGEIVGKDAFVMSRPHLIRGAVLWVQVADSAWMHQLHLRKAELLDKINMRLEEGVIESNFPGFSTDRRSPG